MQPRTRTVSLFVLAGALVALPLALSISGKTPQKPEPITVQPNPEPVVQKPVHPKRKIQVALLLDTSSSMDGLIDQAKSQLWKIVNELGAARKHGERPEIEIALFEYGKSSLEPAGGFIRMVLPLTTDLDKVSEELFVLATNGGEEYAGRAIQTAVRGLNWSASPEDLKMMFIAGNEPFTQGDVDYRIAIKDALAKSITVNTIFCGPEAEGTATGWKDGAVLAEGRYLTIDQNRAVAHVDAPQDAELARLGADINSTYIPYGALGAESAQRQAAQDSNAGMFAGSMVSRTVSKSSANYYNPTWDLVDASKGGQIDLEKVEEGQLPGEMRGMNAAERKAYVEGRAKDRARIQARIAELNSQRNAFVAAKMKEAGKGEADTLDKAMIGTVREQATKNGFEF